jgi:hypothetical protein
MFSKIAAIAGSPRKPMPSEVSVMPELAGREVAREVVELAHHEPRALDPLVDLLLDAGAADADERELRGDEEAVEQHQHDHRQQEQDGHRRRVGRASGAPLLREGRRRSSGDGRNGNGLPARAGYERHILISCASSPSCPPPPRRSSPLASATT